MQPSDVSCYFKLFNLPISYAIDLSQLEVNYFKLQQQFHPDFFVAKNISEKSAALQWSSIINDAYNILKSPLNRAIYLLKKNNIDLINDRNKHIDSHFLNKQMVWRELFEEAKEKSAITNIQELNQMVEQDKTSTFEKLALLLDKNDWELAAQSAQELLFIQKFDAELKHHLMLPLV